MSTLVATCTPLDTLQDPIVEDVSNLDQRLENEDDSMDYSSCIPKPKVDTFIYIFS